MPYRDDEREFLTAMATSFGFGGKTWLIFMERFKEDNRDLINARLAEVLALNLEAGDPSHLLGDQLRINIYPALERHGCDLNGIMLGKRWVKGMQWLREIKYPEWEKENRMPNRNDDKIIKGTPVHHTFDPVITEFNIERKPQESRCLETILQPGSFLRIKGPQHMGKTRLLNRVLAKVNKDKQDNCQIMILNWQNEFDSTAFSTYAQFLENFCAAISQHLGLADNLDKYWNKRGTPNNKTTGYFSDYLLPQIGNQLILVLEEMDLVFNYDSIAGDFCGLLRGWYENSKRDQLWQKLSLVIVHSTDKYASLDIKVSPLCNLGETVTVEEFTRPEVDDLVEKYGLSLTSEQIAQLTAMVEGHPFLANHAFKTMAKQSIKLEEILAKADKQEGIYRDHLLELLNILKENLPLKEAFKKVVTESAPVSLNPDISFKLESLGLVKVNGDLAVPRCPLYRQYFAKHL